MYGKGTVLKLDEYATVTSDSFRNHDGHIILAGSEVSFSGFGAKAFLAGLGFYDTPLNNAGIIDIDLQFGGESRDLSL